MNPRTVQASGLGQIPSRQRAGLARFGSGLWAQHDVAEGAIVAHILWGPRQHVDSGAGSAGAVRKHSGFANGLLETGLDSLGRHALLASLVVHLAQIRTIAKPPGLGQAPLYAVNIGADILVVQEPGQLAPAGEPLAEHDLVGTAGADHP